MKKSPGILNPPPPIIEDNKHNIFTNKENEMKHIVCLEISLKESVHPCRIAEMSSKATAEKHLLRRSL